MDGLGETEFAGRATLPQVTIIRQRRHAAPRDRRPLVAGRVVLAVREERRRILRTGFGLNLRGLGVGRAQRLGYPSGAGE